MLNNKCLKNSANRIQDKNLIIRTNKINEISLSCFDDKLYILKNRYDGFDVILNGYDGLFLDYQS